jgi:hypothetical protein
MTIESKDFEKKVERVREGLIHLIVLDAEKKEKPIEEVLVDFIARFAICTIPPAERVQKLPTARDFKKHIAGKTINKNNSQEGNLQY